MKAFGCRRRSGCRVQSKICIKPAQVAEYGAMNYYTNKNRFQCESSSTETCYIKYKMLGYVLDKNLGCYIN